MESKQIIERWGIARSGQLQLWEDYDQLLRMTEFQSSEDDDFDRQTLIHWWMNIYKGDSWKYPDEKVSYETWQTWKTPLYKYFKYVNPEGWLPTTNQSCLRIGAYKKEPLEDHMRELLMWLPHCKYMMNEDAHNREAQYLSIFEHTCSESGVLNGWIYSPTDCEIGFTRYRQYSVKHKFDSLEGMIDHIRLNYWYRKHH